MEQLNRYLKDCFRSLGVNLNKDKTQRTNKSIDLGVKMDIKVGEFFKLDPAGESHTNKDGQAKSKIV